MKRLLVVVDYQNDFIDGALGFDGADKIAANIVELIKRFKNSNDKIVFTVDTHGEDYLNTTEGQHLPIPHCLKGQEGWKLYPLIKDLVGNSEVFEKPSFGSALLGQYIANHQFDEIYLCGLVSDICVFSNAIIAKTFASSYCQIKVVRAATSSSNLAMQEKAFDVLKHLHIEII